MTREAIATMASECYITNNLVYNDQVSATYQGLDTSTGKVVMLHTFASGIKGHPAYEQWLEQFLQVGNEVKQIKHPHLVKVLGCLTKDHKPYLISENPIGLTLDRYLSQHGKPLPVEQALLYIQQIAKAVEALHRHNLYHQNLHPAHIYLLPLKQKAYVGHFGWQFHVTPGLSRLFPIF
ncbi:MAG: protein kinase family protein [Synechococcaceae cyanobacterium RL_1_2]|nr:protein kinase family protein [Synechococcaceae cyanobacterium RL_1_2]